MNAERKTVATHEGDISYLQDGNGPLMVMVHGLMSNAIDYQFQFERYKNHFTCVAPDLKGSGMSTTDYPEEVSISTAVDDLIDLITEIAPIDQKIILMGHSFGGLVSLETMCRIPERIKALIIIASPAAIGENILSKLSISLLNLSLPAVKPLMTNRRAIKIYSHYLNMNPSHLTPELKRVLKKRNELIGESDLSSMCGYLNSITEWEFSIPTAAKNIPCGVFYGNRDPLFGRGDLKRLQELLPLSKSFLIAGTGHSCMQEKHEEFNDLLDSFLRDIGI